MYFQLKVDSEAKSLIVRALNKEKERLEKQILDGDYEAGTLILHEYATQLSKAVLYTRPKEDIKKEEPNGLPSEVDIKDIS